MDTLISAVLGDLVSRSVSFVVDSYYRRQRSEDENLQRLNRILLRVQVIVEEAEGHHVTNRAMLKQLQILREMMYKGLYLLDISRYHMVQLMHDDQVGGHPFLLSKFSPAKRMCVSTRQMNMTFQGDRVKELQKMLSNLHRIIDDMAEFVVFLKSYPPISREPYSKYLFMERCMFGRQAEMENIVSFLLQPEPTGVERLQVLPIVGPPRVGKSTLVEHVCYDQRVRNHFSSIILCNGDPTAPDGCGVVKKKTDGSQGSLIIVELTQDLVIEDKVCRRLHSSIRHMSPESKVIVTSRSEDIVKLGSTGPIRLEFLSPEAYWYFFKVMVFGSANPHEHEELVSIAMEIATELDRSFLSANIFACSLRANMHPQFWRKVLELERKQVEMNILLFGERPHILLRKNKPAYVCCPVNMSTRLKVLYYQTYSQHELPKTMLPEIPTRSAKAQGKLEVLQFKSGIPPYHSYSMTCEMDATKHTVVKKKRLHSMV